MARWLRVPADAALVDSLAREVAIPPLLARLLVLRGVSGPAEAEGFLRPSLSHLHDPYRMRGMREAVERLRQACAHREKVLIYGDYDVDGTTAVVLLRKALEMAGGQADFFVPHRLKDGYGMREEVIEHAARQGVRVIISVDTGIRDGPVVERGNELGIDTIITDHHLPDAGLPPALAVLNPNQPGCEYPDKCLSGAGVAFKVAQALLGRLDWPAARLEKVLLSMVRLVAIGTMADVVPLTGENRTLVKFGLDGLRHAVNPGLKALLAVAGFDNGSSPTAGQVAFRVAPRLNAAGRMDTASAAVELFSVADSQLAKELAERLDVLNSERQQTEAGILKQALEKIEAGPLPPMLVVSGEGWHRGVLGIVASRLVERFHRPALVLSVDPGAGVAHGSGRSIPQFHLLESLESVADVLARFGGHRQAAGLSLRADRIGELQARLAQYASARLAENDFLPELRIDADVSLSDVTDGTMAALARLEPHGAGNPAPVLAAAGLTLSSQPRTWKEKHLRLALRQNGRVMNAVGWRMAARASGLSTGAALDAAFTVEPDDYWGGWRLVLKDFIRRD